MKILPLVALLQVVSSAVAAETSASFYDALLTQKSGFARNSDFEYPFLISQTAEVKSMSAAEAAKKTELAMTSRAIAIRGHFSKTGTAVAKATLQNLSAPADAVSGGQLDAIKSCTVEKCLMKLANQKEKGLVQKATFKVDAFEEIVLARLRSWVTENELPGYEDRDSNVPLVKRMLGMLGQLKAKYPACLGYFESGFWKKAKGPGEVKDSFLWQELVRLPSDRLQPIWRVNETFKCQSKGATLFLVPTVYSDHYFDSSFRAIEVIPLGEKSIVAFNDLVEVDELTKSALIRALFKGKMEDGVRAVQEGELEKI